MCELLKLQGMSHLHATEQNRGSCKTTSPKEEKAPSFFAAKATLFPPTRNTHTNPHLKLRARY